MENYIKLRSQANAERRAEEAERDGMASNVKGKQDSVLRNQLMGLMMAGFKIHPDTPSPHVP